MVTAMTLIASAPDLSRPRLPDAAADLIAAGGVRAASVRATAQAAGVSASAVSYHFGGREGLHAAAFAQARASAFQRQARALEEALRETLATRVRIRGVKKGEGTIEVPFHGTEDFERLFALIAGREASDVVS